MQTRYFSYKWRTRYNYLFLLWINEQINLNKKKKNTIYLFNQINYKKIESLSANALKALLIISTFILYIITNIDTKIKMYYKIPRYAISISQLLFVSIFSLKCFLHVP